MRFIRVPPVRLPTVGRAGHLDERERRIQASTLQRSMLLLLSNG
jgi:hypothetical protein